MNFREFVQKAETHLLSHGWREAGHNGVWKKFQRGRGEAAPFPAAIVDEITYSTAFSPVVEEYLLANGWHRSSQVTVGLPVFARGDTFKPIRAALVEQLKLQRLSREDVAPRPTPQDMKILLSPESVQREHSRR